MADIRHAGARLCFGAALMLTVGGAVRAQPRPLIGNGAKHARATITAIDVSTTHARLLVTLFIEPGWHVSWRNPGETGLPTRLGWSLPPGVRMKSETWPVPLITHTSVGDTHTLEGDVPWLVDFAVTSGSTVDRLVELTLRYGICRDVCIPEQLTVRGALPSRASRAAGTIPATLKARLTTDAGVIAARRVSPTTLCLDRVPMWSPRVLPEAVVDSGSGVDAALRLTARTARGRRGSGWAVIPAAAVLRDGASLLFVRGAAGVTARLDFRRPSTRCR